MKYKGHDFEIYFCNPSDEWGDAKGLFGINSAVGDSGEYYDTYKEAEKAAKFNINKFVEDIPQNEKQWINAIESCIVWTGYEDCHIDEAMAIEVLKKAARHFTRTIKEN
jgi:hypothetical protein